MVNLAREVALSFSSLAKGKDLEIKVLSSNDTIRIAVDRDRMVQVFTNLVNNAVKFTEKGRIEISVHDYADRVECRVSDTGRGISQEDLPRIFDRFQQFGKSFGPGQEGTGLGLSICKHIIDLHNGAISVDSHLGKGSTFTFILPR